MFNGRKVTGVAMIVADVERHPCGGVFSHAEALGFLGNVSRECP
jgi:hypothetical protein